MVRSRFGRSGDIPLDTISVLAPLLPDPAPPGVLEYLMPGIEIWEARQQAHVKYETSAVENMKAKILINFRQGYHMHDVMYCAGWAQEIAGWLSPLDTLISPSLRADLPAVVARVLPVAWQDVRTSQRRQPDDPLRQSVNARLGRDRSPALDLGRPRGGGQGNDRRRRVWLDHGRPAKPADPAG